jgi:hypothetical protein
MEGLVMSTPNPFSDQFLSLLKNMPGNYSLEEWQYLYREVIFLMGMQILQRFPQDVLGPDPFAQGHGGGVQPGSSSTLPPPGHGDRKQGHGGGVQPAPPPPKQPGQGIQPGPESPPWMIAGHGPGYQPGGHGPGYQPSVIIALTALGLAPVEGKDP